MDDVSLVMRSGLIDHLAFPRLNHSSGLDAYEAKILDTRNYKSRLRSAQFVYGRLLLKLMLADRLRVDVRSLSIRSTPHGLPQLYISGVRINNVSLSLSHDRDLIFVAAGLGCCCAVDVQLIDGIDWSSVIVAMGWSHFLNNCASTYGDLAFYPSLSLEARSALLWTGFEAWMKLSECRYAPSAFAWTHIELVSAEPVSASLVFKLNLAPHCPYHDAHVLLMLRHNVSFAVSTI